MNKKEGKKKRKTDYKKVLDRVFAEYIKLRDSEEYGFEYFKCISCGKILPIRKADAGHYFSRRHNSVRFDEDNVNAECSYDNRFNAEHLEYYRRNLIAKIGKNRFDSLCSRVLKHRKFTEPELKELISHYRELINNFKTGKNGNPGRVDGEHGDDG